MNEHHYQRIDKGIKRTSAGISRRPVPKRRNPETNAVQAIPEGLQAAEVLDRYLTEQTTSQIAQSYGVTRKSLVAWLRDSAPEAWKRVQIIRAHCRKDDADEQIEDACDPLSLARAREMLRSGQWDLERLDSANYGQKQEVTHIVADLGDRLRRARERVIEHEAATPDGRITGVMSHSTPNEIKVLAHTPEATPSPEPRDPIDPKEGG